MITIGVDAHKRVHQAVAVDEAGRRVGQWRGANTTAGWEEPGRWAQELDSPRHWGIEGAWSYGRGLAQHLVAAHEEVYDVNPRMTAQGRRRAHTMSKTDRLDVHAVALVVWREAGALPRVGAEDETAVLDLLVTQRDDALAEATRLRNQIHQLLLQLDPEYEQHLPNLQTQGGLRALERYAATTAVPLQRDRAAGVRRLTERLRLALRQVDELTDQIRALAQERFSRRTQICGVSLLAAAALAGILGPGLRFTSEAQLAAYAGVAPLEASSAERVRHRLNRSGKRRLNAIVYRIALTQAHFSEAAKKYLEKRQTGGKTRREALRALKRYIIRAIWRLWKECVSRNIETDRTVETAVGKAA
jgi:transposase